MPEPVFRGDPYAVLDVDRAATTAQIKRRWRELAREHHPDRAAGDDADAESRTTRMARINAAYDLLRDPVRRARYDASPQGRRGGSAAHRGPAAEGTGAHRDDGDEFEQPSGPPPPPPTRPVTARFDTTAGFRPRDTTIGRNRPQLHGHPPRERGSSDGPDLRASTPTGPVHRRTSSSRARTPSLEEARETLLEFGRYHGWTLGDVAEREPTYVDWIAKTITRDRDLVMRARVVQADLDERGVERAVRPQHAGFGFAGPGTE
jgi:curved DNA-binding protein CbpA